MARTARGVVFDPDNVGVYHIVQRCVRRAFLCGTDSVSGNSYDHRREWIQKRLEFLAGVFAVDVLAFAVMSNHLHVGANSKELPPYEWASWPYPIQIG